MNFFFCLIRHALITLFITYTHRETEKMVTVPHTYASGAIDTTINGFYKGWIKSSSNTTVT
jgi:hypothetical protein